MKKVKHQLIMRVAHFIRIMVFIAILYMGVKLQTQLYIKATTLKQLLMKHLLKGRFIRTLIRLLAVRITKCYLHVPMKQQLLRVMKIAPIKRLRKTMQLQPIQHLLMLAFIVAVIAVVTVMKALAQPVPKLNILLQPQNTVPKLR